MTVNKKKILAALGITVASAAGFFMLNKDGKPVDPNTVQIESITFNGQTINFTWTDDNTNENAIIFTDKKEYYSWGDTYAYVAVKNISPNDQNFDVQVWGNSSEKVSTVEEYKPHQAYQVDVQDFGSANLSCPGPDTWKDVSTKAGPAFQCGNEIRRCSSVTNGICKVDYMVTGTHKETRYRDEWGTVIKADKLKDYASVDAKVAPAQFKVKDQFQYWIPSGQTKYFRVKLNFNQLSKGEFYVKAFGSLGAYGNLDPSWYSNSWGYRMAFSINTSKLGTTTALSNFPFGISTTSPAFAYTSFGGHMGKTDGTDIVITDSDGTTKLSHELEYYASSTGQVILHFKYTNTVPTTSTTTLYMYYGNAAASDQQDTANVWDSNFKIVLHMHQPATATQTDSTITGNNAAKVNTPVADTGTFGSAVRFGLPGPSYLSASNVGALTDFTVCALYKASSTQPTYFRIADQDYANGFTLGRVTAEQTRLYVRNTGTNQFNLSFGAWHYTCGIRSGTNGYLWADTSTTTNTNVGTTAFGTSDPLRIATSVNNPTDDYMNGPIDEFRISNTARSDAWIYTEYQYLMAQSSFYIWGTQESATPAAASTRRRIQITD